MTILYWAAFAAACVVFAGALVASWDMRRQARRKAERVAFKSRQMQRWTDAWADIDPRVSARYVITPDEFGSGSER